MITSIEPVTSHAVWNVEYILHREPFLWEILWDNGWAPGDEEEFNNVPYGDKPRASTMQKLILPDWSWELSWKLSQEMESWP